MRFRRGQEIAVRKNNKQWISPVLSVYDLSHEYEVWSPAGPSIELRYLVREQEVFPIVDAATAAVVTYSLGR